MMPLYRQTLPSVTNRHDKSLRRRKVELNASDCSFATVPTTLRRQTRKRIMHQDAQRREVPDVAGQDRQTVMPPCRSDDQVREARLVADCAGMVGELAQHARDANIQSQDVSRIEVNNCVQPKSNARKPNI